MDVYSFRDLAGALNHPLAGPFIFGGQVGLGQITIEYATERTEHDVAADGNVLISAKSGNNGTLSIEVQQTSILQQYLVDWSNAVFTAQNLADVTNFAAMVGTFRSITTGSQHIVTGVSPSKIAGKTYAAAAGKCTWSLMAGDIVTI